MKFCYFGNTSLRVSNLLYNIEAQLILFKELFEDSADTDFWTNNSELQQKYLDLLIQHNLINTKDISTGTKNARAKSAPLEDYNLVDRKKKIITPQGEELLLLLKEGQFNNFNNFLQIDLVSLFFLKATLNFSKSNNGLADTFLKYLEVFKAFDGKLSNQYFRLLPLLANFENPTDFINKLKSPNFNETNLILELLYNDGALNSKKELFFADIESNSFSNPIYFSSAKGITAGKQAIKLYAILKSIRNKTYNKKTLKNLFSSSITGNTKNPFKKELSILIGSKLSINNKTYFYNYMALFEITRAGTDTDFDNWFFYFIYFCRVVSNLQDYISLNKYYLDLTGIFEIDADNLTLIKNMHIILKNTNYKSILNNIKTNEVSISSLDYLLNDTEIKSELLALGITSTIDLKTYKYNEDKDKLLKLLNTKFTKDIVSNNILPLFKNREDQTIKDLTTDRATVPTIFEYIIAISMYYFDNKNIDFILKAGLSLDSNMLPKSHAVGGNSDFKMEYSDHTLMVEVSLTEKTNQRRAEMESVSRHLGNILLSIDDTKKIKKTFGIFIATYLDKNVINDFRIRRVSYWENKTKVIKGMNILPMDIDDVISVLKSNKTYKQLRPDFYTLINLDEDHGSVWYDNDVKPYFTNL